MTDESTTPAWYLRNDGVSLLIGRLPDGTPYVTHWGTDLGELSAADARAIAAATSPQSPPGTLQTAWRVPLVPFEGDGWSGRPGAQLRRDGTPVYPRLRSWRAETAPASLALESESEGVRVCVGLSIEAGGLIAADLAVTNTGSAELEVDWLEAILPVPRRADRLTTFDGRWSREKAPYTSELPHGATLRQNRRGRDGHDAPTLFAASVGEPRNRTGEFWAVHLGWSGDVSYRLDRLTGHETQLGAGELLRPGELVLEPGEQYRAPTAYFAFSAAGWDGLSARFHTFVRNRPGYLAARPRPLTLNSWEAVYFDHDPARIGALAETAAGVGIERFVLDDGWFLHRRDDHAGLGDWQVDAAVWPDGLEPLAGRVHELGMQFGLWFEPEMVNLDSDLARAHPDWLLHHRPLAEPYGVSWRDQHVLDLANPDAWRHVFDSMSALVGRLGIDYIKWDHNRDLVEAEHDGRPGVHAQTRAAYRLMRELKAAHPGLEIESCSSGGARTDLGVMAIADRVWASDSNDAIERQDIQRWTQLLLPPELVGSHVGPSPAHSSGRMLDLSFRLATSLMGHAGFEWDLAECTPDELEAIRRFAALYRELRPVLHGGVAVHDDVRDPALRTVGYVLPDASQAVYSVAAVAVPQDELSETFRLHGLDPDARYRVRVRDEVGLPRWHKDGTPGWLDARGVTATGRVLAEIGLLLPVLWPAQALVLHATRE